jgi:hypothetical protein
VEPDSPARDVAIWMMQRAIANRTKLAIAQTERLGKHIHLLNDKEQWRVQREEVNLELGYMVELLHRDMPDFAELNPKLFKRLEENFIENDPNLPNLVEDF